MNINKKQLHSDYIYQQFILQYRESLLLLRKERQHRDMNQKGIDNMIKMLRDFKHAVVARII